MKKVALLIFLFIFAGCGGGHSYRVKQGTVSLYLDKSEADLVYFASSLDGYKLHEADRIDNGTWEVQVPSDYEFQYFYIVDGVVYIPACTMTKKDDFGSENCVYVPGM